VPRICVPQVYTFLSDVASGEATPFHNNANSNSPDGEVPLHVTIRRDMHAKFETEVNERIFGIKPPVQKTVSEELRTVLAKCGVPPTALPTFLKEDILTISDAKLVFHSHQPQPAALNLSVMQWTRLCRELNPPPNPQLQM